MKAKILFLCGLKSCGKTYYAQKLSQRLQDIIWYDTDKQILKLNQDFHSCRELYKALGPETFREKEQQAIESLIEELPKDSQEQKSKVVVSLGGGICDTNNGLKLASEHGILVYLKESEAVLYERMLLNTLPPYLKGDIEESKKQFHEIYAKRDYSYSCFAKYVINLSEWPEEQVLDKLERLLS